MTKKDKWIENFRKINNLFLENEIEHAFIKIMINPLASTDIDVLIPDPLEEEKALAFLQKEGFKPDIGVQGRFPSRLKIPCKKEGATTVDIYPDCKWHRTKVCDVKEIMNRAKLTTVEEDIKAYRPVPSDDFYLLATHCFYDHLEINEGEIKNATHLASDPEFSWDRILNLTRRFGTSHAIYTFLLVGRPKIEASEEIYEKLSSTIPQLWVDRSYPLQIPLISCVTSSICHSPHIFKNSLKDGIFDFLSHYVRLYAKLRS